MDELDDQLKQALRSGHRVEVGGDEIDSVRGLMTEMFRFRSKLITAGSVIKIAILWVMTAVTLIMTFVTSDPHQQFLWAFGCLISAISLGILWQFHWAMLHRNAMLRELKRLELQIAGLMRQRDA